MSELQSLLGSVDVRESRGKITVTGVKSRYFNLALDRYFQTQTVKKYIFTRIKRNELQFASFFAIEFDYMVRALMESSQRAVSFKVLERIQELLHQNTWLARLNTEPEKLLDSSKLRKFHKDPLDYQEQFFRLYERNTQLYDLHGYMLAAPAGAGKTLTNLMLYEQLGADRLIIISPKHAVGKVWQNALENEYKRDAPTVESSTEVSQFSYQPQAYIVHYEAIDKFLPLASGLDDENVFIVIDESHNFNEPRAQRTQNLIELTQRTKANHVIWASGTPIKALGKEMVPFLQTIDKRFTDEARQRFVKVFGYEAARARELLTNRLGLTTYKIDKSRVVSGQPREDTLWVHFDEAHQYTLDALAQEMSAFVEQRIGYYKEHYEWYKQTYETMLERFEQRAQPMSRELQQAYQQYKADVRTLAKTRNYRQHNEQIQRTNAFERERIIPYLEGREKHQFRDAKSVVKYVELKIQGEALGEILTKRRIDAHRDMVHHTPFRSIIDGARKKTVIFTSFVEVLEQINETLKNEGYRPMLVYGRTNDELEKIVSQFDRSEKANPLIATYQSLSTAVPLTMANNCILFNQPFRDYVREQATSRLYRLGQDEPVFIWNVLLDTGDKPNISTRSKEIVEWSKEQVDDLLQIDTDVEDEAQKLVDEKRYMGQIRKWLQAKTGYDLERIGRSFEHRFLDW